jgi:hypothetical protein
VPQLARPVSTQLCHGLPHIIPRQCRQAFFLEVVTEYHMAFPDNGVADYHVVNRELWITTWYIDHLHTDHIHIDHILYILSQQPGS